MGMPKLPYNMLTTDVPTIKYNKIYRNTNRNNSIRFSHPAPKPYTLKKGKYSQQSLEKLTFYSCRCKRLKLISYIQLTQQNSPDSWEFFVLIRWELQKILSVFFVNYSTSSSLTLHRLHFVGVRAVISFIFFFFFSNTCLHICIT